MTLADLIESRMVFIVGAWESAKCCMLDVFDCNKS